MPPCSPAQKLWNSGKLPCIDYLSLCEDGLLRFGALRGGFVRPFSNGGDFADSTTCPFEAAAAPSAFICRCGVLAADLA